MILFFFFFPLFPSLALHPFALPWGRVAAGLFAAAS